MFILGNALREASTNVSGYSKIASYYSSLGNVCNSLLQVRLIEKYQMIICKYNLVCLLWVSFVNVLK